MNHSHPANPMDSRFRVDCIAATPNPQQCMYAAMHQDYSEGYVFYAAPIWPYETRAGKYQDQPESVVVARV